MRKENNFEGLNTHDLMSNELKEINGGFVILALIAGIVIGFILAYELDGIK